MVARARDDARSGPAWSGLVVPATPVPRGLASFRRRHIHHPGVSVPFHTTIAAPFLPLPEVDDVALARLRTAVAGLAPFDYRADAICCFPTTSVLWLAPNPVGPFERVAEAVYAAFPQVRPTSGHPTFHLTVALGRDDTDLETAVRAFRAGFEARLPFRLHADRLDLYGEAGGRYRLLASAPFGG